MTEESSGRARTVVIATRNPGKLRELEPMLREAGFAPIDLEAAAVAEDPAEEGIEVEETFLGNALAKARWFHERTGLPTLADDSGLVVESLGGAPGVRSRRFSGRHELSGALLDAANNAALTAALEGVEDRRAAFVCAAALVLDGREYLAEGRVEGRIVEARAGLHGFGYDPHFYSIELGMTFAEAAGEVKARVSHRGRAIRALMSQLRG